MSDKPIFWLGTARKDLANFPDFVKRKMGFQLRSLQQGQQPTDFKPIPAVGQGVEEIRVQVGEAYRVFYVAKFSEAIYVLHAFQKKTQKTSKTDLKLGKQRYNALLEFRRQQKYDT
ncbi:type II toxin-antitoxin system RelE/ParE family toxin [Lusitaniella coriacea LEGE 07157]|uniref:Type II toxin-antitoxin system RelE/ParE family toxin n=1 Tax=Lusitaniella coriacea LEGE 07157 TaxID=945747 RepID=A0A8J7AZU2_9CYAN|nr:type II toxin-antitoxin system RelE/ParE family toxin [Lusitaniella coriacea]MBE9114435.1 type II toxin-antitoxin system RelE/ParE family toxin [Lusitaniella coriacea LEGE 07157]